MTIESKIEAEFEKFWAEDRPYNNQDTDVDRAEYWANEAYLAAALAREKRIEELEDACIKGMMREAGLVDTIIDLKKRIEDLEKKLLAAKESLSDFESHMFDQSVD